MNDQQIRELISEMRATHSKRDGNPDAYRLALIAEELMLQRDRRSEDFYRSNRAIHTLEAELAKVRAAVAEEIAQALDQYATNYPEDVFPAASVSRDAIGGTAMRHAYSNAAQMARDHGKGVLT